jgi:flagellar hook-length control protein FliK
VASVTGPAASGAHAVSPATPSAPVTAPPTAATQLAHATAIHFASGATGQITIHLQPADLGAVQVRIERGHDGTATITVQVERADTMHMLQVDLPHLHQALDRAGVPTESRQVSVELAQAPPPTNGAGTGGEGQRHGQPPRAKPQGASQTTPDDTAEPNQRWRLAGINITA